MYVLLCMLCACACVRLRAHVCVRACVRPVPTPSPGPGGVRINFTGGNARPMVAAFGLRLKPTLTMSRTAWRPFRNPSRTLGLRAIGRPLVVGRDLRRRRSRGHDTESKVTGSPSRPQRIMRFLAILCFWAASKVSGLILVNFNPRISQGRHIAASVALQQQSKALAVPARLFGLRSCRTRVSLPLYQSVKTNVCNVCSW